jgi:hypothetical protein
MTRIVLAIVLLIVVAMLFGLSVGVFSGAGGDRGSRRPDAGGELVESGTGVGACGSVPKQVSNCASFGEVTQP